MEELALTELLGRTEFAWALGVSRAHGAPRSCCVKHANPTEFHGGPTEFHGISTELRGVPRSSTEFHGVARSCTEFARQKGAAGLQDTPPLRSCLCCGLSFFYFLLFYLFIYYFYIFYAFIFASIYLLFKNLIYLLLN